LLGPLSACRTADATAFRDAAYGAALEKWLGIHVRHRLPADPSIRFASGTGTGECKWWCDAYEPAQDRKVLGRYAGGALDGLAAAVECRIGKGKVILLGTQPPDEWLQDLIRELAAPQRVAASPGVEVCARVDASGHSAGVIAVNTDAKPGTFKAAGKQHQLPGFGVMILPAE
jgi:beta-galactosidase